jgi:hypothetical protein
VAKRGVDADSRRGSGQLNPWRIFCRSALPKPITPNPSNNKDDGSGVAVDDAEPL